MDGRNLIPLFSFDAGVRKSTGALRIIAWALAMALCLCTGYVAYEGWQIGLMVAFLVVGTVCATLLWTSHMIWSITITPMIREAPFWVSIATKIPFWYMAGGVGYTSGMLMAKILGLLFVYDQPVGLLFAFGGKFAVAVQIVALLILLGIAGRGKDTGYDENRTTQDH